MRITIADRASYPITHREFTDEGFLKVPGRVARTGIQVYLARELGLDGDPLRAVKVYRSPEEVFKPESLATYQSAVLTDTHPDKLVTAKTYKKHTVGDSRSEGRQDDQFVVCDLVFKDEAVIKAIMNGKCELSAGYTAEYVYEPGVTSDGEEYEYVQRNIKINHIATVDRARAGPNARLFDHNPETTMTHKVTLDSGRSVEVQDEATAVLLSENFERLNKKATDAEARADKAQAAADSASEQLEAAKKASSDEAIAARVTAISETHANARKVAGDEFTCDSLDVTEIKRAALVVARPKVAWGDKSAAYVEAAFDSEMEKEESEEDKDKSKDKKSTGDAAALLLAQLAQLSKDGAALTTAKDAAPELTPYQREKQRLRDGHKNVTKGA